MATEPGIIMSEKGTAAAARFLFRPEAWLTAGAHSRCTRLLVKDLKLNDRGNVTRLDGPRSSGPPMGREALSKLPLLKLQDCVKSPRTGVTPAGPAER